MTDTRTIPYQIENWSSGYVDIDPKGDLLIKPNPQKDQTIHLSTLLSKLKEEGLRTPVLVRFKDILHDRVNHICNAFNKACEHFHYTGQYQLVYPIKVNQQRRVVEEVTQALPARARGQIGLEAGSKAELLAVLALSPEPGSTIICNGYKDQEFIEMALRGRQLGFNVYIVVEKLSELELILNTAKSLSIKPKIGIRARLASIGKGNWQNTGGEKSKFGLSAQQILEALDKLITHSALESLTLLHFHLGSQIANIRDIQIGLKECAQIYSQLMDQGVPIDTIDVGGGLGVDYDGTRSRSYCSINYSTEDYANHVVKAFKEECLNSSLPEPNIISESGRAITAHHAILITDVIDSEEIDTRAPSSLSEHLPIATSHLQEDYDILKQGSGSRSLIEVYHDAAQAYDEIQSLFIHGSISIKEKSEAERLYLATCELLLNKIEPNNLEAQEIKDELSRKLATKIFTNFSLFQSIPDAWGIGQIFPILPLTKIVSTKRKRAVIQDITCDSDGRIDQYVGDNGVESTLALPENAVIPGAELAFFLLGAYQEILGDMHNLFGDTDSVDVGLDDQGNITVQHAIRGDTMASVLEYVNLSPNYLLEKYQELLRHSELPPEEHSAYLNTFEKSLESYTYLQREK